MKTSSPETTASTCSPLDANGVAIRVGSVLQNLEDGERGVVAFIARAGESVAFGLKGMLCHGDLGISTGHGTTRVTNIYSLWRHIPKDQQTYIERYTSWLRSFDPHAVAVLYGDELSMHELTAIDGIVALLPENTVDWEEGPWPDSIEKALEFLAEHLSKVAHS